MCKFIAILETLAYMLVNIFMDKVHMIGRVIFLSISGDGKNMAVGT